MIGGGEPGEESGREGELFGKLTSSRKRNILLVGYYML